MFDVLPTSLLTVILWYLHTGIFRTIMNMFPSSRSFMVILKGLCSKEGRRRRRGYGREGRTREGREGGTRAGRGRGGRGSVSGRPSADLSLSDE